MIPWEEVHPDLAAFMKDAAGLWRSEAGPFLQAGRMIDLGVDPGRQEISGKVAGATRRFAAPALMARGFDLRDGARGLLFINATGAPRKARISFGPGRGVARASVVWPAAGTGPAAGAGPAGTGPAAGASVAAGAERTLKPREILFLRVEKE
jgi:hypothetical protein